MPVRVGGINPPMSQRGKLAPGLGRIGAIGTMPEMIGLGTEMIGRLGMRVLGVGLSDVGGGLKRPLPESDIMGRVIQGIGLGAEGMVSRFKGYENFEGWH